MSEVKLNIVDSNQVLHGKIHGSVVNAAVAALSAEPETISELEAALDRYEKRTDGFRHFAGFDDDIEIDDRPWDAGIVVIDLLARIVASESTYSLLSPEGEVNYHDGHEMTDLKIYYRIPNDWRFVSSVAEYEGIREERARTRLAPPLDVREILYGAPLLEYIARRSIASSVRDDIQRLTGPATEQEQPQDSTSRKDDAAAKLIYEEAVKIHADWLMTPRAELGGMTPREVILAKQDFIDFDLHTRAMQWSFQGEGPPCLSKDSFAFRYAGFGTHEWVIYYDLLRYLICSALEHEPPAQDASQIDIFVADLEQIKTTWLTQPQEDCGGRTPANLIENERRRLPIAMSPSEMIIDEDCPACQALAEDAAMGGGPSFWHLDGSHMEEDFAFSSFLTREEWEEEERQREAFAAKFNRDWEERQKRMKADEMMETFADAEPF
jgi:hypothetical protein